VVRNSHCYWKIEERGFCPKIGLKDENSENGLILPLSMIFTNNRLLSIISG